MSSPLVRRAVPADIPQLAALIGEYWRFEGISGFDATRIQTLLARLLPPTGAPTLLGAVWIACQEAQALGYLIAVRVFSLEHQGLMAEIDEFFVREEARSRGVGAALLDAAERELAAEGCVRLQLQLGRHNAAAREFYSRRGYAPRNSFELMDRPLGGGSSR